MAGAERDEWTKAWRAMPLRRLPVEACADFYTQLWGSVGPLTVTGISETPARYSSHLWCETHICPVCRKSTAGDDRLTAALHVEWPAGAKILVGVWVHRACLASCPDVGKPGPVPW